MWICLNNPCKMLVWGGLPSSIWSSLFGKKSANFPFFNYDAFPSYFGLFQCISVGYLRLTWVLLGCKDQLSSINYQISNMNNYRLSIINDQISIIIYQLSSIKYQLSIVKYQLWSIKYQLLIIKLTKPTDKWGGTHPQCCKTKGHTQAAGHISNYHIDEWSSTISKIKYLVSKFKYRGARRHRRVFAIWTFFFFQAIPKGDRAHKRRTRIISMSESKYECFNVNGDGIF